MGKVSTLHYLSYLLSLAGLSCCLLAVTYLAGIRPTQLCREAWIRTVKIFRGLSFVLPVVGVRTRRLVVNGLVAVLFFMAGYSVKAYQYHVIYLQEYKAWKQRSEEYKRIYQAWLEDHPQYTRSGEP